MRSGNLRVVQRLLFLSIALLLTVWLFLPGGVEVRRAIHVKRHAPPDVSAFSAEVRPLFDRNAAELEQDCMQASLQSGGEMPDLTQWWRVVVSSGDAGALLAVIEADPQVESAYLEPLIAPASFDVGESGDSCPIQTPSYAPYQLYLAEAPAGINAPAAWMLPGGRGQNRSGSPTSKAAGINSTKISPAIASSTSRARSSTTAAGRRTARPWSAWSAAKDNGIGIVGIAPDVGAHLHRELGADRRRAGDRSRAGRSCAPVTCC